MFLSNGIPPRVLPSLVVQRLVVQPRRCSSLTTSSSDRFSRYSSKICRTQAASSSFTTSLDATTSYPSGGVPPDHFPLRRAAAILSRVRSLIISRSNWANDSRMFSVSRPIELVVLKCWVTETNETVRLSNRSMIREKSISDRLRRSTL